MPPPPSTRSPPPSAESGSPSLPPRPEPLPSSSADDRRDSGTASESSDSPPGNPPPRAAAIASPRRAKTPFVRVWAPDDEIALLRGLISFQQRHGHEPSSASDLAALLSSLRHRLRSDFSTAQLASKIRHTKRKYLHDSAAERGGGGKRTAVGGGRRATDAAHREAVYELSGRVWGAEADPGRLAVAVDDPPRSSHEGAKDDGGGDPRWARDLILKEFGEDAGSSHMLGGLEKALAAMSPDVVLAFGQRLKELGRDRYRLWRRQMQLRIDIVGVADEALAGEGQPRDAPAQ